MAKKLLPLVFVFSAVCTCLCEDSKDLNFFYEVIAPPIVKNMAKTTIAVADIEKLKLKYKEKILDMQENKFKYRLQQIVQKIKGTKLEGSFGLNLHMTKQEAAAAIQKITKKDLYETIELIPDEIIAAELKEYFQKHKDEGEDRDIVTRLENLKSRLLKKSGL